MFDLAWSEILLIIVVLVFVLGPDDLPAAMYGFMKFGLKQQFDSFMEHEDLTAMREGKDDVFNSLDMTRRELGEAEADLKKGASDDDASKA